MKRTPPLKQRTTIDTKQSNSIRYRLWFSRGLTLGIIPLAAFIVLTGNLLHGQGGGNALFIDEKGTVKVQEIEVKGATSLGDAVTVEGATELKSNLTVSGNVGIGTNDPKSKLAVNGTTNLSDTLTVEGATELKNNLTVNGTVGIGTNDPKAKLDVKGDAIILGTLKANKFEGDGSGLTNEFVKFGETIKVDKDTKTVQFDDLNLKEHGTYLLIAKICNPLAVNFRYSLYMNNDKKPDNYGSKLIQDNSSHYYGDAIICIAGKKAYHTFTIFITKSGSDRHVAYGHGGFETDTFNTSGIQAWRFFLAHNKKDNLKSLTIQSEKESGIGPGSEFILYRAQ